MSGPKPHRSFRGLFGGGVLGDQRGGNLVEVELLTPASRGRCRLEQLHRLAFQSLAVLAFAAVEVAFLESHLLTNLTPGQPVAATFVELQAEVARTDGFGLFLGRGAFVGHVWLSYKSGIEFGQPTLAASFLSIAHYSVLSTFSRRFYRDSFAGTKKAVWIGGIRTPHWITTQHCPTFAAQRLAPFVVGSAVCLGWLSVSKQDDFGYRDLTRNREAIDQNNVPRNKGLDSGKVVVNQKGEVDNVNHRFTFCWSIVSSII